MTGGKEEWKKLTRKMLDSFSGSDAITEAVWNNLPLAPKHTDEDHYNLMGLFNRCDAERLAFEARIETLRAAMNKVAD